MELILLIQQQILNGDAQETLRQLSPWAYVIVLFAIGVAGVFLRLYITERREKAELEKEFRSFMSDSLTKQIDVSKDVIDLVSRNKDDIKDALHTWGNSDTKTLGLISEVKTQLINIERLLREFKNH